MTLLEKLGLVKRPKSDLAVLDNIFPHLLSAFRVAEFSAYLSTYERSVVYSTSAAFPYIGEKRSFEEVRAEYALLYPHLAGRALRFDGGSVPKSELLYFVFLQNARAFLRILERSRTPFVFTLYPGGGFQLEQPHSDETLRRVCALPNLRKVITTQKITRDYLLDGRFLGPEKAEFVYGVVLPADRLARASVPKKRYLEDKRTFDICFVAYRYMAGGADKGYDVFAEAARELAGLHPDIFFHVVGTFDETDADVSDLGGRIKFYGARTTEFFPEFYSGMDIILSPNAPFKLLPGAFDGFPTGSCIEAALCGVAVFCADPLGLNAAFKPDEEIVIITRDVQGICHLVDSYYKDYDRLARLAWRGQEAFRRVFSFESQMTPRLKILSEYLPAGAARAGVTAAERPAPASESSSPE